MTTVSYFNIHCIWLQRFINIWKIKNLWDVEQLKGDNSTVKPYN